MSSSRGADLILPTIYEERANSSCSRIAQLAEEVGAVDAAKRIPHLTIFVAGSYARLEASDHSDLDLFFLRSGDGQPEEFSHTNELELFGDLIRIQKNLGFPRFSADCKYLEIHTAEEIVDSLGSREDDARNFFTLRLLMILEGRSIYGDESFDAIRRNFVKSYFRDYDDHQDTFEPMFLVNDIARYWRTLLANYEHRRNRAESDAERIQQKVRNYKLKFSRLTTCFATVAAISTYDTPVTQEQVEAIISKTPAERLVFVAQQRPVTVSAVQDIVNDYAAFLEMTGLPTEELEGRFMEEPQRREMDKSAAAYGDKVFDLLKTLDGLRAPGGRGLLRTLVV